MALGPGDDRVGQLADPLDLALDDVAGRRYSSAAFSLKPATPDTVPVEMMSPAL
jgi:hypothetical protein